MNRVTGLTTISIPAFQINGGIDIPEGATHARVFAVAALLDFNALTYVSEIKYATELDLTDGSVSAITLSPQGGSGGCPAPIRGSGYSVLHQHQQKQVGLHFK